MSASSSGVSGSSLLGGMNGRSVLPASLTSRLSADLPGTIGCAALAALHQRLVGAQVELAFLEVAAVAEGALVDEDRLDVLLVERPAPCGRA